MRSEIRYIRRDLYLGTMFLPGISARSSSKLRFGWCIRLVPAQERWECL